MRKIDSYDKDFLITLLREMNFIRRFEEKAGQMYGLKKIGGFCHLYNGQEAVAVGSFKALDMTKDYVLTGYRDHAHALASGMSPKGIMAELYGKATGVSRGKGGSMHMFDVEKHMLGGNGIVGGQIPVAAGVALMQAYKKTGGATLGFFGDGAIHQGSFHETLNLAKIWNLPVVFICENNQFGMGTAFERVSSVTDFSVMGQSYGIPGWQVDGMDVIAVLEEVGKAAKQAREEGLPAFLEIKTYRYKGHSMSDPAKYRTKDALEEYKQKDPILNLKERMLKAGHITEEQFKEWDKEDKKRVQEAVDFADNSPEPPLSDMYEDILA